MSAGYFSVLWLPTLGDTVIIRRTERSWQGEALQFELFAAQFADEIELGIHAALGRPVTTAGQFQVSVMEAIRVCLSVYGEQVALGRLVDIDAADVLDSVAVAAKRIGAHPVALGNALAHLSEFSARHALTAAREAELGRRSADISAELVQRWSPLWWGSEGNVNG